MKILLFCLIILLSICTVLCIINGEGRICGRPNGNGFAFQEEKIVEGYDVGYYRYPWYVALVYPDNKVISCGAALIGRKSVATAAHCYKEYVVGERKSSKASHKNNTKLENVYSVLIGVYNKCEKEKTQKYFEVEKVYIHEKYKDNWPYFDIALLILKESAASYEPICLPKAFIKSRPREGSVPGLGTIRYHGSVPCTLREARLLIYSDRECQQMINRTGNDPKKIHGAFCAGYLQGGIDTCQGDSGGPFQIVDDKGNYILLGLVSFGFHCANPGLLGVYTDVTQFVDWIQKKTGFKAIGDVEQNSTSPTTEQSVTGTKNATTTISSDDATDDADADDVDTDDDETITPIPVPAKPSGSNPSGSKPSGGKPSGGKPSGGKPPGGVKPWWVYPSGSYPEVIQIIRPVLRPVNIFIFKNKKKHAFKEKSMPNSAQKHNINSAKKSN